MAFDAKAFQRQQFTSREEAVPVPDLKQWFTEDSKLVWKVRGLSGDELGRVNEAVERYKGLSSILEGLCSANDKEKVQSLRELFGVGDDEPPADIVKRLELLTIASVDPVCDLALARKLKDNYPIEFMAITTRILQLTGQGAVPGKPRPSTETKESGQP